jgi:hypothetical protein
MRNFPGIQSDLDPDMHHFFHLLVWFLKPLQNLRGKVAGKQEGRIPEKSSFIVWTIDPRTGKFDQIQEEATRKIFQDWADYKVSLDVTRVIELHVARNLSHVSWSRISAAREGNLLYRAFEG